MLSSTNEGTSFPLRRCLALTLDTGKSLEVAVPPGVSCTITKCFSAFDRGIHSFDVLLTLMPQRHVLLQPNTVSIGISELFHGNPSNSDLIGCIV